MMSNQPNSLSLGEWWDLEQAASAVGKGTSTLRRWFAQSPPPKEVAVLMGRWYVNPATFQAWAIETQGRQGATS